MAALRAGLGFKLHTGWTAVVAATWRADRVEVLLRRRLELLPADGSIPRFVYHTASEIEAREAAALVKCAETAAQKMAQAAVKELVEWLRRNDVAVSAAGIPTGSAKVPSDLAQILGSHPLIHSAEGALFQEAVRRACENCGLSVITIRERELLLRAAEACGRTSDRLRDSLESLRKATGPPWGADQKTATAAALLALAKARV